MTEPALKNVQMLLKLVHSADKAFTAVVNCFSESSVEAAKHTQAQ